MTASPDARSGLAAALDLAPPAAARRLLGATLTHAGVAVRLTEVEAYGGPDDPGSHAFRRTARSEVMYGPAGRLYVYSIYGLHVCANVVVGDQERPGAVLLRAGVVVDGLPAARERRPGVADVGLARGPANLCRALALSLGDNRCDLDRGTVRLELSAAPVAVPVASGPRVGLRRAPDVAWRFWIAGEPSVSTYRPAVRRRRTTSGPGLG